MRLAPLFICVSAASTSAIAASRRLFGKNSGSGGSSVVKFAVCRGFMYDKAGDDYVFVVDSLNKKVKYPAVELSATGCDRYFVYKGEIVEADYIEGSATVEELLAPSPRGYIPSGMKALRFECAKGLKHRVPIDTKNELQGALELMNIKRTYLE